MRFVLDSGAEYSVVPRETLHALGIAPHATQTLLFGDGSEVVRGEGVALFEFQGASGESPVLFGEPEDDTVLGKITLARLGFFLDPFRRELRPLPTRR